MEKLANPRRLILTAGFLVVLAVVGYFGGWNLWAAYHFRQAQHAIDRRSWPQARAHLRLCLEVWHKSAATHFLAARTARRAEDFEDAAQHLNECENLHGPPEDIELERALLRAQQGDLAPVERELVDRVEQNHPDAPLILEALLKGCAQTARLPLALACTAKWLRLQPDNVEALFWQGLFYERLFSHEKALEDFRRVVELDPTHEEARLHLAEELVRYQLFDEALVHLQRLVEANPENAPALLALARCQSALGHSDEALVILDRLVRARPDYVPALVERGKLALETSHAADAERWLRKALAVTPRGRTALYLLVQCLEQLGRHDEAQEYQKKLKEIDAAWKRLEEVMRKLMSTPLDSSLRFEAGTLMLRVGKEEEGRRLLHTLLADVPGHGPAHQALAEYYEGAGDAARAAYHRQRAAQAGSSPAERMRP